MSSSEAPRPAASTCPLCGGEKLSYLFAHAGTPIVRCDRCRLVFRNPQPSDDELAAIDARVVGGTGQADRPDPETAAAWLDEIDARPRAASGTRRLHLDRGLDALRTAASARGYMVAADGGAPAAPFDVAVVSGALERARDPLADLRHLWRVMSPGGTVLITVPTLDSWSARVMREGWPGFRLEHLYYFDSATLQLLLFRAGFEQVTISAGRSRGRTVGSGLTVLATRSASPPPVERRQRLSVIMPVFNERATFPEVIDQLLRKSIPGVDIEIVIVESRSTDGTRDAVARVEGHPRVKIVYEDRPRGKGHAVRTGLIEATGDYVLIQDADLEYDLGDYEALLEPLMNGRAAFVLGTRHGREGATWKVRHFADQAAVSWFMNLGHVFFTALFNVTYGTRLRDPFTMFKVFRRDCLHGLTFEANRFDFDWELVGKLVRAGYRPLEIPVNYRSRSFHEGKKVSLIRDPLTWLRACFKYRFEPLGKKPR